ncbi:MAG TPA: hypothetical protein VJZ93_02815 [Candidatus Nanoarchaeia archaeon]|nr:hypothetical protein [Candidatus Nanoarchaeia archaeon]
MNRRGIISDYLPWLAIAIGMLVILALAIFILREKGLSVIDSIKNLLSSR